MDAMPCRGVTNVPACYALLLRVLHADRPALAQRAPSPQIWPRLPRGHLLLLHQMVASFVWNFSGCNGTVRNLRVADTAPSQRAAAVPDFMVAISNNSRGIKRSSP